jgi:hypothetical protein
MGASVLFVGHPCYVLPARRCGYCQQVLKVIHTVRKLNIVDIVLQLSLWCVGIKVTVTAPLNAVRNMYIERERHISIVCDFL